MEALNLTLIFLLCEFADIFLLNKSESLKGFILGSFARFGRNKFLFFVTHFSFIFLAFCVFYLGILGLLVLFILYFIDIITKFQLFSKINDPKTREILDLKISFNFSLFRVFISLFTALIFYFLA